MNVEIPENIQGLDAANAELDKLIAADAAAAGSVEATGAERQRAAQTEEIENVQGSKPDPEKKTDTPAETETAKKTETEKTDAGANKSRYEKARDRQERTWQELNAQKEAFKTEQETLKKAREEFERERHEYQAKRDEAEKQFTPEQYESAAKKFEAEGKFDLADLAKTKADELRKNPPALREGKAAQATEASRKEWTLKTGVDFPDIAKQNSPLQLRVAQLFQEEPELKAHPKGIYLAARLASLETEAARVSSLQTEKAAQEKELGQLRAKVKELEGLTAPGGPGSTARLPGEKSFEQMSESEQFQALAREAQDVGVLTR
jgi:hypothetical protein